MSQQFDFPEIRYNYGDVVCNGSNVAKVIGEHAVEEVGNFNNTYKVWKVVVRLPNGKDSIWGTYKTGLLKWHLTKVANDLNSAQRNYDEWQKRKKKAEAITV